MAPATRFTSLQGTTPGTVGDEACVMIDFGQIQNYARPHEPTRRRSPNPALNRARTGRRQPTSTEGDSTCCSASSTRNGTPARRARCGRFSCCSNWQPPIEFKGHWTFPSGGGMAIAEADSAAALVEATSPFTPFFDFKVEPVVPHRRGRAGLHEDERLARLSRLSTDAREDALHAIEDGRPAARRASRLLVPGRAGSWGSVRRSGTSPRQRARSSERQTGDCRRQG